MNMFHINVWLQFWNIFHQSMVYCSVKISLCQHQMTDYSLHIIMVGGIKNNNNHSRQNRTTCWARHWVQSTGGSLSQFAFLSFSTSVHDKQTYPSVLCPAWLPPAPIHCIYQLSLALDTHYSLKPLRESEGASRALIRRSYRYSESTDCKALRTRRHCNLHHFQESEQMLLHTPP